MKSVISEWHTGFQICISGSRLEICTLFRRVSSPTSTSDVAKEKNDYEDHPEGGARSHRKWWISPRAQTQGLIRNFSAKSVPGASQYLPRFCQCYGQLRAIDPLISLPYESLLGPASLILTIHFLVGSGGWRKVPILCFLCSFVFRLWRTSTSNHVENCLSPQIPGF